MKTLIVDNFTPLPIKKLLSNFLSDIVGFCSRGASRRKFFLPSPGRDENIFRLIFRERSVDYESTKTREVWAAGPNEIKIFFDGGVPIKKLIIGIFSDIEAEKLSSINVKGRFFSKNITSPFFINMDSVFLRSLERPSNWIDVEIESPSLGDDGLELTIESIAIEERTANKSFDTLRGRKNYFSCRPIREASVKYPPLILVISMDGVSSEDFHDTKNESIEKLRIDSINYKNAYCSSTVTGSAAASLLTGVGMSRHHIYDYDKYFTMPGLEKVSNSFVLLPELMKEHGFATFAHTAFSKWRPHYGYARGFDEYSHVSTGAIHRHGFLEKALGYIDNAKNENTFVLLHLPGAHPPLAPSVSLKRKNLQYSAYESKIKQADQFIGAITGYLKGCGLYDSSLIVVTSDHGRSLHPYKRTGYQFQESRLRIPFLLKLPHTNDRVSSCSDFKESTISATSAIYSIICDAIGIRPPAYIAELDNRSFHGITWVSETVDYSSLKSVGIVGFCEKYKWVLTFAYDINSKKIGKILSQSVFLKGVTIEESDREVDSRELDQSLLLTAERSAKTYLDMSEKLAKSYFPFAQKEDTYYHN